MEDQNAFNTKRNELKDDALLSGKIIFDPKTADFSINPEQSVSSQRQPQELPNAISLEQNYPNPFNPQTTITYQIDTPQHVRLDVFNAQGQRIYTLMDGVQATGSHSIRFNAASLPSGVYMHRIYTETDAHMKKMLLVR